MDARGASPLKAPPGAQQGGYHQGAFGAIPVRQAPHGNLQNGIGVIVKCPQFTDGGAFNAKSPHEVRHHDAGGYPL